MFKAVALFLITSLALAQQVQGPFYSVSTIAGSGIFRVVTGDGGPATSAWLASPSSLALDRGGNLYIAERYGRIRKVTPAGVITTIAGYIPMDREPPPPGVIVVDNSPAVAVDDTGVLYIAAPYQHRVLKLTADGNVSIVAGTGSKGYSGDGGPASAAELNGPSVLAFDRQGNLYIGEITGHRVRKINPDGTITTVAGTGEIGFSGDGGPATEARITVLGIAVDDAGSLYITDVNVIRKIAPNGVITTVAGARADGIDRDGIPATSARLYSPAGVAIDHAGNLYIAESDNHRVRKVTPDGIITTAAGTGTFGFLLGDNGDARASQLNNPSAVLVDDTGNLYIADSYNGSVRKVTTDGKIRTIAGSPMIQSTGDGGPASQAQFAAISALATDGAGNIYIADPSASRIRKIGPDGAIATVAGTADRGFLADGVLATATPLNAPGGVAVDRAGNLYIADTGNHRVRRVGADGVIRTIAGAGVAGFSGDGGPAIRARLAGPTGLALDSAGNLYIADTGNQRIRKVTPVGVITTVAGSGEEGFGGDGQAATNALLSAPIGLAVNSGGDLYIADAGNQRIRKLDPTGVITTGAGTGTAGWSRDGHPAVTAELNSPTSVALDAEGNLFIADRGSFFVRKVDAAGIITTVVGGGSGDGPGFLASLFYPQSVATDRAGNLYVTDGAVHKAVLFRSTGGVPQISPRGIVNAASWQQRGAIAPGEIVTLFGADLGPAAAATATVDASGQFGTLLAGTRVFFDGIAAPVLAAQTYQVTAIVPFGVAGRTSAQVEVEYQAKRSPQVEAAVVEAAPAILTLDPPLRGGRAAALNEDGTINSPSNPALRGSIVALYVNGAGQTDPPGVDGQLWTGGLGTVPFPVFAAIGDCFIAGAQYAGPAPGLVSGLVQVNIRIPEDFCGRLRGLPRDLDPGLQVVLSFGFTEKPIRGALYLTFGVARIAVR